MTPCPAPTESGAAFPKGRPAALPHPPFATSVEAVPAEAKGVQSLKFTTAESLRDAVIFVTEQYPKAGWVIGDGDSEGHEADIPFSRGDVHGKLRLTGVEPCTTTWLIATVDGNGDLGDVPGLDDH